MSNLFVSVVQLPHRLNDLNLIRKTRIQIHSSHRRTTKVMIAHFICVHVWNGKMFGVMMWNCCIASIFIQTLIYVLFILMIGYKRIIRKWHFELCRSEVGTGGSDGESKYKIRKCLPAHIPWMLTVVIIARRICWTMHRMQWPRIVPG